MTDVHTPEKRSYNMSRIRSKNTKPEMLVRKYLHKMGFRYRLHKKDLPGHPDIVLKKYNAVIFINGCFWHGHKNCKYFKLPLSNTLWWQDKIERNIKKDFVTVELLQKLGWKVVIIWECELKASMLKSTLEQIKETLTNNAV